MTEESDLKFLARVLWDHVQLHSLASADNVRLEDLAHQIGVSTVQAEPTSNAAFSHVPTEEEREIVEGKAAGSSLSQVVELWDDLVRQIVQCGGSFNVRSDLSLQCVRFVETKAAVVKNERNGFSAELATADYQMGLLRETAREWQGRAERAEAAVLARSAEAKASEIRAQRAEVALMVESTNHKSLRDALTLHLVAETPISVSDLRHLLQRFLVPGERGSASKGESDAE